MDLRSEDSSSPLHALWFERDPVEETVDGRLKSTISTSEVNHALQHETSTFNDCPAFLIGLIDWHSVLRFF